MRRIVVEDPGPLRPGHDVQIVEIVTVRRADRVIAARHEDDVAIFDAHSFIERAIVGVDALKCEALRRVEAVIVDFFERRLLRLAKRSCLCGG